MNSNLHEPEFVKDTKNAVGYFVILAFVTLGAAFIVGGMFSPIFLPMMLENAKTKAATATTGTFEENYKRLRSKAILLNIAWFIAGWGIFLIGCRGSTI